MIKDTSLGDIMNNVTSQLRHGALQKDVFTLGTGMEGWVSVFVVSCSGYKNKQNRCSLGRLLFIPRGLVSATYENEFSCKL